MTRHAGICVLLLALWLTAAAQTVRDSSGRVSAEGPYQSQVRLLEDKPDAEPTESELLADPTQDAYGRALVLRQLAQRGIASGDTDAAIASYEQALSLDSLSPLATAQMQVNLGQLYTLAGRYGDAVSLLEAATAVDDYPDAAVMMSLATAYLQNGQPGHAARKAEEAIAIEDARAPLEWSQFAVHAFWQSGEPAPAATWQLKVLDAKPDEAVQWLRLAALYRSAGETERALATLQAAALRGLLSDDDDWLKLIQMHIDHGTPDIAAQWLKPLVDARPDAQYWHWYGQILLRSGDEITALSALTRWADLAETPDAWLEVGELATSLAMQDAAADALRRASRDRAGSSARGRALLLLGQVELERGNTKAARRAFTQASEYGGVYRAATEWLDFLEQSTASDQHETPLAAVDDTAAAPQTSPPQTASIPELAIKTTPLVRVFAGHRETNAAGLSETASDLVSKLIRASRRERLEWTGPLHIVVTGDITDPAQRVDVRVAAPIRRTTPAQGEFRSGTLDTFRCVWRRYEGPFEGLEQAWRELYVQVLDAGLQPAQEARQVVLHRGGRRSNSIVELQIGILLQSN